MRRKQPVIQASLGRQLALPDPLGEPDHLLSALFGSSTVGVAICDRQLRFQAVNDALASMNGLPATAHVGKTIHAVLGKAASLIQPAFEHVFATGLPLSNFELTAELPRRDSVGHRNESYFPIKDDAGQVQHVGAIVLELTQRNELHAALLRLTNKVARLTVTLRGACARQSAGANCPKLNDAFLPEIKLLEGCLSDARSISQLLSDAPHLSAVQWGRAPFGRQLEREQEGGVAMGGPIQSEADDPSPLSLREREVVALLAAGLTNKQIGARLTISTRTVESHRAKIMLKLDMHSLSELVRYAVRTRLIRP